MQARRNIERQHRPRAGVDCLDYRQPIALHGAFWHSNYGVQMSHGCVNLAPLDAKWLFFFSAPDFRAGYNPPWLAQRGEERRQEEERRVRA